MVVPCRRSGVGSGAARARESVGLRHFAVAVAAGAALLAPPPGRADTPPGPTSPPAGPPSGAAPFSPVAPVRLIVRFRGGAGAASAPETLDRAHVTQVAAIPQADTHVVEVPALAAEQTLADLNADPNVAYAEPDGIATAALAPDDPLIQGAIGWVWNDFAFPAAWDITTGSPGVVIADLDSGVNAGHPDLVGSVLPGMNFTVSPNTTTVADDYGHGTETAGVLAARGNNGIGVAGACWSCKILPVKVLSSSGFGYWSWIESGIYWATDHGARVINLSLGGPTGEQSLVDAIDYAVSHGVFVAIAAGNAGSTDPTAGSGGYPAYYAASISGAVSVGAVDDADNLYSFSDHGSWVEVNASGLGVTTTRDGSYVSNGITGTSFSAPEVAGLAGLALSLDPDLTPAQLEQLIRKSASTGPTEQNEKNGGETSCDGQCTGGGLLDAHKVLATLAGAPLQAPSASTAPTISGGDVVREGIAVTGSRGTWQGDQPIRYGYQWQRCAGGGCVPVAGATEASYTPAAADVGSTLRFVVTASNSGGSASAYAETVPVRAAPPANQSPPTISGAVRVGETLTGDRGSWSSADTISFDDQWQRCLAGSCTSIAGETGTTYQVASADVGRTLRFVVTASNSGGSASAYAETPGAVPPPPLDLTAPTIAGTPQDGQTLKGSSGSWTGTGTISYSYRWQRCSGGTCTDIPGAGASTYTATAADVGNTLRLVVTASDSGGSVAAHADTAVVAAVPPALVSGPTISGTLREGQTLTAAAGFSGSDPVLGYEWRRDGTAIPGATLQSYTLASLDVGATIGVLVTARNSAGSASGTATGGVVAAAPPAPVAPSGGGGGAGGGSIPDLTAEITTDAPPALGQSVTYRLRVYDKPGFGPTSHATAVFELPGQVQISSVYLGHGRGCTREGQTLACDLDFLGPGEDAVVVVVGTVTSPGELVATGSIWAMAEQNTTDDTTRLVLAVADPSAPGQAPSGAAKGSSGGETAARPTVIAPLGGPVLGDTLTVVLPAAVQGHIQWQASRPVGQRRRSAASRWNAISGATGPKLKVGSALVGCRLRVVVTVAGGSRAERFVSAVTGPIGTLGPLRPRIVPHGTLPVGATVTALLPKPFRGQPAVSLRYRWQVLRREPSRRHGRWLTLPGAASPRLKLGESLAGHRLRVVVAAGAGKRRRTVASAPAGPVR